MRVLLIKMSSMGDLIHTLPALTDAGLALPHIRFDWVVEEAFTDIPSWHPFVESVIPVALRRWRKQLFAHQTHLEWRRLHQQLRARSYDLVLDAQALVKSAFLTFFVKTKRVGLDWRSARERLASLAYQHRCTVDFYQHAVMRMRCLFSQALHYSLPVTAPCFGINRRWFEQDPVLEAPYLVFLHGTMWATKQWPEAYWRQLAQLAIHAGYRVKVSGGNDEEVARAQRIGQSLQGVDVLPRLSMTRMAQLLIHAQAVITVDTGFGHLAAALEVPTVSLYGPTHPTYTGLIGRSVKQLAVDFPCAPCLSRTCTYRASSPVTPACFHTLPPESVWQAVQSVLAQS